ncbi:MAG: ComF family protein [Planctomycetaceae bacterium]|jgi:ComF family protein|nr:ComF family protein [Planctomycetaceae bacterium]
MFRKLLALLKNQFTTAANLLCPPFCVFCEEMLDGAGDGIFLCGNCQKKFTMPAQRFCVRCGSSITPPPMEPVLPYCVKCQTLDFAFSRVIVLGEYGFELREAILKMKTDKPGHLAVNMAKLFIRERREQILQADADLVVPVPMHFLRRFQRGVNSPVLFAQELAEVFRIPPGVSCVTRNRYTKPQFRLNADQRRRNVRGAFTCRYRPDKIRGKKILLVDDIITTRSTCHEIATVLRAAGAKSVTVAVLASAEGKTFLKKTVKNA